MDGWLLAGIIAWLFILTAVVVVSGWATTKLWDLMIRREDKILDQRIQARLDDTLSPLEEGKQDG